MAVRKAQRVKGFIDANVYDEARRRMHHIYDIFDSVIVAFSGGKDSLVVLHLAHDIAVERGDHRPIKVMHRGEELIPDSVNEFVNEYRQLDWIDMRWYCVPKPARKYILGHSTHYIQYDPAREHLRPIPEYARTTATEGYPPDTMFDRKAFDDMVIRDEPGKVAIVTGLRAAESIMRFNAMKHKLHDNYINATESPRAMTVKPIFDWQENDVFRYFYDHGIRYCPIYDAQLFANQPLRVSTPLHAEAAKSFDKLRASDPEFYARVMELFPEMEVQERYFKSLDREALVRRYGQSFDGIGAYIDEYYVEDEESQRKAHRMLHRVRLSALHSPEAYPLDYVLKVFMSGIGHKPDILPPTAADQGTRRRKANA